MDDLASSSQWQIIFAIAAAAAFSCAVGWFVDDGFARMRRRYQRWRAGARARSSPRAPRPADDTPREFGDEFVRALTLAIKAHVEQATDQEAIIDAIVAQLGWSPTRARWFFDVNRDQVEQAAQEARRKQAGEKLPCSV